MKHWQQLEGRIDPKKAGYSDMRLWPAQLVFYHVLLIVAASTDWVTAVIVLVPIAVATAIMVNDYQEKTCSYMYFDHEAFESAKLDAARNGIEINSEYYDFKAYNIPTMTKRQYIADQWPEIAENYRKLRKIASYKSTVDFKKFRFLPLRKLARTQWRTSISEQS